MLSSTIVLSLFAFSSGGSVGHNTRYDGPVTSGYTGSVGDGTSCISCHSSSGAQEISVTGWVTSNVPASGYVPGNTYTFTVTNDGGEVLSFQGTSEDENNTKQGVFSDVGTDIENPSSDNHYIGHTNEELTTKSFDWTAPIAGTGTVNMYSAIINGDNGGGTKTNTYLDVLSIEESNTGIYDELDNTNVSIFPNPSNGVFTLTIESLSSKNITVNIVSIQGQVVYSRAFNSNSIIENIDLSLFSKGVYFVNVLDNKSNKIKKIFVR